ncbi:flavin reductase family protein [bacterium]|nr:flavin reductase family protein [bacterium]
MRISDIANPRQVILVTARWQDTDDIITLAWHMPLSFNPMMYAISLGKKRFSLELIRNSKVFVVNFVSKEFKEDVLFCGEVSGREVDKFKETRFEKEEAETINCSRIKQALGYLECEVVDEIETGDHILFIGKVKKAELKKHGARLFHISGDKLGELEDA